MAYGVCDRNRTDIAGSKGERGAGRLADGCMLEVVGALGDDELRHPVRQGAEHGARTAVVHHGCARRQQIGLRDEPLDPTIRGERHETCRILLLTDRCDDLDGLTRERVEHDTERLRVRAEERTERDVHDRPPRRDRCSGRERGGSHRECGTRGQLPPFERGRAHLKGYVSVQPGAAGHVASERPPDRGHGIVGEVEDLAVEEWSDQVGDAWDAEHLSSERADQCVVLEQHQVRFEVSARGDDVVDHVVDGDLTEQPGNEVVVDPLRRDPITGIAPGASREPLERGPTPLPATASRAPDRATTGAASAPVATTTSSPSASSALMIGTSGLMCPSSGIETTRIFSAAS